ncbi:MAG TPA: SIMPL domain-containing protein [Caldimonas sp.]|nr:SIMPL domain-containing protein [Caldimonas sp.]
MTFDLHRLSFAAVATLCLAFPLSGVAQGAPPLQGVLGLSSSASVDVAMDVIVVTFAATKEGADAGAVQSQLKQALDTALAEARKVARAGEVDVQTGNFSIWPRYATTASSSRTTISGWQGSAQLIVEGRDMATIGALTGRISTMSISNVGFRLSHEAGRKVEADVAAQAIARFRAKAEDYVKQFGYSGYAIREVNVAGNDAGFRPQPMLMRAQVASVARSEPLPVEPGKATITATVNGTVQMK